MKQKFRNHRIPTSLLSLALVFTLGSCKSREAAPEPVSDQQSAAKLVEEAVKLYAGRDDLNHIRQGIALLREAHAADYSNYEAAWRLAQFNYYLAAHATGNDERDNAFRAGIEAGQAAVKLQSEKPDGHFWLGANYGGSAETGTLAGLTTVDEIRNEMETVLRLDEGYQSGSAYMVLSQLYLKAPKIMGGDTGKAVEEGEKGLRFGADNDFLRLRLAEAYFAVNRDEDGRKQLQVILSETPNPDYLPEHQEAMNEAHKLLEKHP